MSSSILAAAAPAAGDGAPLWQLAVLTAFISAVAGGMASMSMAYRAGRAPRLRKLVGGVEALVGLPGWAAVPGFATIGCALMIITSATWDIGLHIDVGRDSGPLGTAAHYPLLFGLLGVFLMGILAIGLAPRERRKTSPVAINLPGLGLVPAAAVLLLAGSAFGMAAFPLDDLWHRLFGQDVTLWGPTHVMIIGGTISGGIGGALLLIEGALSAGVNPFAGGTGTKSRAARILPVLLAGIWLYFWTATMDEFNWGVPQYREVWQPMLLAFGAAQTFVIARLLIGKGGSFAALAVWLPVQVITSLVIGGPLKVTMPTTPLFIVEAVVVEAIGLTVLSRRPMSFGVAAGVGVGTIGFAANYLWTNIAYPLPWTPAIIAEGLPMAFVAALAGGALGAAMATALRGELLPGRRSLGVAALAVFTFIALGVNASITDRNPLTATLAVTNVRMGPTPNHDEPHKVGDVTVSLSDPSRAKDANWFYVLGWQGDGRYLNHLVQQPDGSWKTTQPVPLDGKWKTMVRLHKGRDMMTVAVRFPSDEAVGFPGIAVPTATPMQRDFMSDTKLLQIERKDDVPSWAWTTATIAVLSTNLLMVLLMGLVSTRLGRIRRSGQTVDTPNGLLVDGAEKALGALGLAHPAR
ncbi:MAG: hypothetical protein J7513_02525 [Solirubrobacteraceae bacterium]|nr:hypothetical protein [Solirubrobacteraceae bacterium]